MGRDGTAPARIAAAERFFAALPGLAGALTGERGRTEDPGDEAERHCPFETLFCIQR